MKNILILFLATYFIFISQATLAIDTSSTPPSEEKGWMLNGKPVPDSENIKSKKGFGAQRWLIDDDSLFENWNKLETPSLSITNTIEPNCVGPTKRGFST